ncbi:nitroreductase [Marinomonas agarivorans]|nr:nitroreductase [Marinomonas agarivorans]
MKEIIEFIRNRESCPQLTAPAPNREEWLEILTAASRAADHGALKPWRYRIYQGAQLDQIGECYWQHALTDVPDLDPCQRENFIKKAHRAPAILLVYAATEEHSKVPEIEQIMAVAAATQQALLAIEAKGYGAMWRTGAVAHTDKTKVLLNLKSNEQIIGFVYVGTPKKTQKTIKEVDLEGRIEWFDS